MGRREYKTLSVLWLRVNAQETCVDGVKVIIPNSVKIQERVSLGLSR